MAKPRSLILELLANKQLTKSTLTSWTSWGVYIGRIEDMSLSLNKEALIIKRYVTYLDMKGYSNRTVKTYTDYVRELFEYLKEREGIEDLKDVDKKVLHRYQDYLYNLGTLALTTQALKLTAVISLFKYLDETEKILYNPASSVKLPKSRTKPPPAVLDEKEMKRLLAAPDIDTPLGLRDRAILELLYSTGMRNSELCDLELYDIDIEEKEIRVRKGKGGKARILPVGKIALLYLTEYMKEARDKLVKDSENKVIFVSRSGKKLTRRSLTDIVAGYADRAGIKSLARPHVIRHSVATHLLRRGAAIRYIQELLGHTSLISTQRYAQVEINDLKRIHRKTHPREKNL